MAEFQEVMEQWKRMCDACDNKEDVKCCIDGVICGKFHAMRNWMNVAEIEKTVMQWAAEHPEPVYPTWSEWLMEQGLIYASSSPYMKHWFVINQRGIEKPIPADIAEKLGIEPKEAEHGTDR